LVSGGRWWVGYFVIRLAQDGIFLHPDVKDVVVARIPVAPLLQELLIFIGEKGYGPYARVLGRYESWDEPEEEHPCYALLQARPEAYRMSKTILSQYFEDPYTFV
jgi:hypothetical protein